MKDIHFVSADEAVQAIKSGDHIHLSSVASVPHILIDALVRRAEAHEVEDLHFHHFHTEGPAPYSDPKYMGSSSSKDFSSVPTYVPMSIPATLTISRSTLESHRNYTEAELSSSGQHWSRFLFQTPTEWYH